MSLVVFSTTNAVERPLWRRFVVRFTDRAGEHVRRGGFAAVVDAGGITAWLPVDAEGALTPLAALALASIELDPGAAHLVTEGPGAGLRAHALDEDRALTALDWCDRDAVHPGFTRRMTLDCVACTACCQDADVVLEPGDLERLEAAGHPDLAAPARYRRDASDRLHLPRLGRRCDHLELRGTCAIYAARFEACRALLPGSEPCLSAREDTLDLRDDVPETEADLSYESAP